jgi:hypothetical protein
VAKGDHQGRPVAIKQLKVGKKREFDNIFVVSDCARSGSLQSAGVVEGGVGPSVL